MTAANRLTSNSERSNSFSPRVGLVYTVTDSVSLYADWSRSFLPDDPSVVTASGNPLPNEHGYQYEGGVKLDLVNGLTGTFAVYDINLHNVPTVDPSNTLYSLAVGQQSSRGFEADVTWQIQPGWNALLRHTPATPAAKINKDTTLPTGVAPFGVPSNTLRLWSVYEVQDGPLKGAYGFGGGLYNISHVAGNNAHTYFVPGYTIPDAVAYYKIDDQWRFQLNASNLFNEHYWEGGDGAGHVIDWRRPPADAALVRCTVLV